MLEEKGRQGVAGRPAERPVRGVRENGTHLVRAEGPVHVVRRDQVKPDPRAQIESPHLGPGVRKGLLKEAREALQRGRFAGREIMLRF